MRKIGLLLGAVAAATGLSIWTAGVSAQSGRTIWDGVYTEAQATRGAQDFSVNCAPCHGVQLEGTGEAPTLAGPVFVSTWNGLSLGELFDRIRTTMPQQAPGSLSRDTYADIEAYILKYNGFPAGQKDLDRRSEVQAMIQFVAQRPAGAAAPAAAPAAADPPAAAAAAPAASANGIPASSVTGANAPNSQPDPYAVDYHFFKLPPGRIMGSSSAVAVDSKGHIWIADRCGANSCEKSNLAPVMEFDANGNFVKAFGAGMFSFPHGLFIDHNDHIWLTDSPFQPGGKGFQVFEFDQTGKLLRTLGKAGVSKSGPDTFFQPTSVLVTKDGTIFVADGHENNAPVTRIVKFSPDGKFIKQWGSTGGEQGQLAAAHALAMDSQGRLYVGDRWNNRIQIYDQDGKLLGSWAQFGRPSGIYIDKNDILYSADSESREPQGYGYHPGWKRGIRIGSVRDGIVRSFIPDSHPNPDAFATSDAEGIWADDNGVVYGAQVNERVVARYTRK